MSRMNRIVIASMTLIFVSPGAVFMTALFVRNLQPVHYEPARTAVRLVDWYSARPFLALDIFLIALPLAALVTGGTTVIHIWRNEPELRRVALETLATARTHLLTLLIAGATVAAAGILAVVALHMISD